MAENFYPLPNHSPAEKSREEYMREFREKQAARHRETQAKLRLIRTAKRRGEVMKDLPPLYD